MSWLPDYLGNRGSQAISRYDSLQPVIVGTRCNVDGLVSLDFQMNESGDKPGCCESRFHTRSSASSPPTKILGKLALPDISPASTKLGLPPPTDDALALSGCKYSPVGAPASAPAIAAPWPAGCFPRLLAAKADSEVEPISCLKITGFIPSLLLLLIKIQTQRQVAIDAALSTL